MTRQGCPPWGVLVLAGFVHLSAAARAADEEATQPGGTMVMGMTTDPPTVNPAITAGAPDRLVGCMVYESLVRVAKGFRVEPALAKSWDVSPDGLRYTFHLVTTKWHDGTPFTSRDVAFSLENISGRYGSLFTASRRAISGHLATWGTPSQIADMMQEWLETNGCDGFNVMTPYLPRPLEEFVELVMPELQQRGLFHNKYEGRTLRENLGLQAPPNRFAA
jgi:hypothetical protein